MLTFIMMKMKITVRENEFPVELQDVVSVNEVISSASEEACAKGLLNIISVEADNGNYLTLVVGGDETVLGFNYGHQDPPYYVSKGKDEGDEPMMTAYIAFRHHTEFPGKRVLPIQEGMLAVHEFCETGELPRCIEWTEV
jgi:hypothetical protein